MFVSVVPVCAQDRVRDCVSLTVLFTDKTWRELWAGKRQNDFKSFNFNYTSSILGGLFYKSCIFLLGLFCIFVPLCCFHCSVFFCFLFLSLFLLFFCLSLYTPLLPNSLTSMCPLGLRTSLLAGPLTGHHARKANMTGSRQGGLLQVHHCEGCEQNRLHDYKLTWVWSKCHPCSFHSSLHPYFFQTACTVVSTFCSTLMAVFFFFFFFWTKLDKAL